MHPQSHSSNWLNYQFLSPKARVILMVNDYNTEKCNGNSPVMVLFGFPGFTKTTFGDW